MDSHEEMLERYKTLLISYYQDGDATILSSLVEIQNNLVNNDFCYEEVVNMEISFVGSLLDSLLDTRELTRLYMNSVRYTSFAIKEVHGFPHREDK